MARKPKLTSAEREQRRRADRERLRAAAQELLSSEGWARWVRVRSMFRNYSAGNCMLLAHQCHERGIQPQHVAGFRTWLKLGRCVRKGETALRVFAPMAVKERDSCGQETGESRIFFKTAFVFDLSQTEPLPGIQPTPLKPPSEPLTGDSHTHLIAPAIAYAQSLGYTVSFQHIPGEAGGWCDTKQKQIVIDTNVPANAQLRTLVHETIHAMGIDYQQYRRAQAEVIVDTTTLVVLAGLGLDISGETVPYVAGWGENGELDAVTKSAELIDDLARRIEDALTSPNEAPPAA